MEKHKFSLTLTGSLNESTQKAQALAELAAYLDTKTLQALAKVVKTEPQKVALAKKFLGIS